MTGPGDMTSRRRLWGRLLKLAGAASLLLVAAFSAFAALVAIPFDEVAEGPKPVARIITGALCTLALVGAGVLIRAAVGGGRDTGGSGGERG